MSLAWSTRNDGGRGRQDSNKKAKTMCGCEGLVQVHKFCRAALRHKDYPSNVSRWDGGVAAASEDNGYQLTTLQRNDRCKKLKVMGAHIDSEWNHLPSVT